MDASLLFGHARRRLAADPEACPIDPGDMALALVWLSALETEAEIDTAEVERALAAEREGNRAAMAAKFREAARGGKPAPAAPKPAAVKVEVEEEE